MHRVSMPDFSSSPQAKARRSPFVGRAKLSVRATAVVSLWKAQAEREQGHRSNAVWRLPQKVTKPIWWHRLPQVEAGPELFMSEVVMWNGNKRIQTQVLPVTNNTITIRSLDWDRDRFDIEFG